MNFGGIDPLSQLLLLPGGENETADFIAKCKLDVCVF